MSRKITIEITIDTAGMSDNEIKEFYIGHFKRSSTSEPKVTVTPIKS